MTVAIAAGGTAGHQPRARLGRESCVTVAIHVVFVGQSRKLEGRLVPEAGFDFVPITVTGFDAPSWTALTSLWRVNKPSVRSPVISQRSASPMPPWFGAYVEVPLLGWCKARRSVSAAEQNSVPGLANR
ncbi:MAG: glycosyltransferase [Collinsella sp.]